MYSDPSLIRDHVYTVRFNDLEDDLVQAIVNYTGQERAVVMRDLVIEGAKRALFADASEAPQLKLDIR